LVSVAEGATAWWSPGVLDRGRWGEIVNPTLERIAAARDRGRVPHALLLVGPPGLGRELAAVETAVMLVCDEADAPWSESPCADRVRRGIHPDVTAMMPEGKKRVIKIDPIRDDVVDAVGARPYEGLRRVWIFDGVEAAGLGAEAANAFLKTLEEPPEHVVFVLLAGNPTAVLPTIRSRCQQLTLPGPAVVAGLAGESDLPPELAASALIGVDLAGHVTESRSALAAGLAGEPQGLLELPYRLTGDGNAFEIVATVATEMAAESDDGDRGEGLARLAADLLATDRRCRALNLDRPRQLASCLMRWYRDDVSRES
jgi:hypothetical protein